MRKASPSVAGPMRLPVLRSGSRGARWRGPHLVVRLLPLPFLLVPLLSPRAFWFRSDEEARLPSRPDECVPVGGRPRLQLSLALCTGSIAKKKGAWPQSTGMALGRRGVLRPWGCLHVLQFTFRWKHRVVLFAGPPHREHWAVPAGLCVHDNLDPWWPTPPDSPHEILCCSTTCKARYNRRYFGGPVSAA